MGMQIAPIDFNLVRDAYQFRLILEKEAVAHFTETVTDREIQRLRDEHEEILRQAEKGDVSNTLEAHAQAVDWAFHDLLVDSLRNEIIAKAYRVNSLKIRLIRQELTHIDGHVIPVMKEHLPVIIAIQARDAKAAVKRLVRHIETARERALGMG